MPKLPLNSGLYNDPPDPDDPMCDFEDYCPVCDQEWEDCICDDVSDEIIDTDEEGTK